MKNHRTPKLRMKFKQFLQSVFERLGLAELPAPPPPMADLPLADPLQLRPILARLAAWGTKRVHWIVGDAPDADDLVAVVEQTVQLGMKPTIRGRASELVAGSLLADLHVAGAEAVEVLFLSSIGEVHDALCGGGDYRSALTAMDLLAGMKLPCAAQIAMAPSTRKTIQRTLEFLDDRGIDDIRLFAVACRDDEPSSWALSAGELIEAAREIEVSAPDGFKITWYPPLRFDPSRSLAQQVRRGPRAAADSVRIEPDGQVLPPIGAAVSGGNLLCDDWKTIARSEIFRDLKRRSAAATCAECPGLNACKIGCLRDAQGWVE